jgi:hypothetical protein
MFLALWALAYAVELSTTNRRENHMDTEHTKTEKLRIAAGSLANTIWAIGASALSGILTG